MRNPKATIPGSFIALDTNIDAADSYCNVHDHHVARQNHNKLFAERVKKSLIQRVAANFYSPDTYAGNYAGAMLWSRHPVTATSGPLIISSPIYVTQGTRQVRFKFRAARTPLDASSTLDESPIVYARIRDPRIIEPHDVKRYSATISTAWGSIGTYSMDLPVPTGLESDHWVHGRTQLQFEAFLRCYLDTTYAVASAVAITDAGSDWFTANSLALYPCHAVYWSDSTIMLRGVLRRNLVSGTTYKYFLDEPFDRIPEPGVHTVTGRQIQGIHINAYSLYELPVTDFNEGFAL